MFLNPTGHLLDPAANRRIGRRYRVFEPHAITLLSEDSAEAALFPREYRARSGVLPCERLVRQPSDQGGRGEQAQDICSDGDQAAAIGVGGLVAAPSASAQPARNVCDNLAWKGRAAMNLGNIFYGLGDWGRAAMYYGQAEPYFDAARNCVPG